MTFEQITNLLDRGFTPDQITSLAGIEITRASEVGPDALVNSSPSIASPEESPAIPPDTGGGDPTSNDTPPPIVEGGNTPDNNTLADVMNEIKQLRASVQAQNIKTQSVNTLGSMSGSVEDALAAIIRPPINKKEET